MKFSVTFKKRISGTSGNVVLWRVVAIIAAMFVVGIVLLLTLGDKNDFGAALSRVFVERFFSERITMAIKDAVPLIIVTLGIAVAFRMKLWNIGGNGQMIGGSMGAYAVWMIGRALPGYLLIPLMILAAFFGGALTALIPAVTKAYLNVNETITTLMMNYIMVILGQYMVSAGSNPGPWNAGKGFEESELISENAMLTEFGNSGITTSVFIAIALLLLYYFIIQRSKWGYEICVTGESNNVAQYAGMPVKRNTVLALLVSGAIAGIGGYCLLCGTGYRMGFSSGNVGNLGFTAVMLAWLSRLNPWGIAAMTFVIAGVTNGATSLQSFGIDKSVAEFIQGIVLIIILGFDALTRYKLEIHVDFKHKRGSEQKEVQQ